MFCNKCFAYGEKRSVYNLLKASPVFCLQKVLIAPLWKTSRFRLQIIHLDKDTDVIFVAEEQGSQALFKSCLSKASSNERDVAGFSYCSFWSSLFA